MKAKTGRKIIGKRRKYVITVGVNEAERKLFTKKAELFADGNMSLLIRAALLHWRPQSIAAEDILCIKKQS